MVFGEGAGLHREGPKGGVCRSRGPGLLGGDLRQGPGVYPGLGVAKDQPVLPKGRVALVLALSFGTLSARPRRQLTAQQEKGPEPGGAGAGAGSGGLQ